MANVLSMEKQILVQQLIELGWSYRRIERETGIRRETISRYDLRRTDPAHVPAGGQAVDPQNRPKCPPEAQPARRPTRISTAAPYEDLIREGLTKGLSAQRLYQDLVTDHAYPGSYDAVKRFVRRLREKTPGVYARLHTLPGEEAQVDFGQGAPTLKAGRYVRPWLFKMVLSFSRHCYEEVVWEQDVETFIRCHEHAFEAFGGVVRIILLDNLKSGVLKANLYEPQLNPAYAAFARHAGFAPLPCLPGRPEHKGKTESGVGYTQENALKGLRFDSIEAQNAHLRHWNRTWARQRIHGTTKKQVWAVFLDEEKAQLQPLVLTPFTYFKVGQRKVHLDGHIEVERAYYSVPHRFVGQRLTVHSNRQYVKVLGAEGEVVAYHRCTEPGRFQTETHHLPEHKTYSRETYKTRMLTRLAGLGPFCRRWAEEVIKQRDVLGLRALQGVAHLQAQYPAERIDAACRKALHLGSLRYHTVALLVRDLDESPHGDDVPTLREEHPALRPLSEYQRLVDELSGEGASVDPCL